MAKTKKTTAKATKKKATKRVEKKAARKATKATPARSAPPARPRNTPLPGMEHVRYTELDGFCEALAGSREKKNALVADEKGYQQGALQAMRKRNVTVYKHDGVELVRVPGDEKVRVRLVKGEAGDGADIGGHDLDAETKEEWEG